MDTFSVRFRITKAGLGEEYQARPGGGEPTDSAAWTLQKVNAAACYVVRRLATGDWLCGCVGWERYGRCKHVLTMRVFVQESPGGHRKSDNGVEKAIA